MIERRMSEYEARPEIEILPQNLGDLTGREAAPILERAAGRIKIIKPQKSEFWTGVCDNLEGASLWFKAHGRSLADKSVRVVTGVSLLSSLASACAKGVDAGPIDGIETPAVTAPVPSVTLEPTYTLEPTQTATPTEAPTQTPEILPAFVPEGFSEGPLGLLRNPETGKDTIVFNKDANWEQTRNDLIGGLWEINVDWSKWTGRTSDATKYKTEEEFIQAAKEGKTFHIGIPVRMDGNLLTDTPDNKLFKSRGVVLRTVTVKLDNIQLQILASKEFREYTGKSWDDDTQPAFDCASLSTSGGLSTSTNACLFTTQGEDLTISIGSFYNGNLVASPRDYAIGSFETNLHQKYPTYFREDGLGINADRALAYTLGSLISAFPNYDLAHELKPYWTKGKNVKSYSTVRAGRLDDKHAYILNPTLFIFSP